MKKSDLKTGHVVEIREDKKHTVLLNSISPQGYSCSDILVSSKGGFMLLNSYDSDLLMKNRNNKKYDITAVYKPDYPIDSINYESLTLIWKRKPEIELDIKINGKKAKLSDLSEETLLNLRKNN